MSDAFPTLQDSFNGAAKAYSAGNLPMGMLLAHYLTAMRHGEAEPEEKRNIAATMFDLAYSGLDKLATLENYHHLQNTDFSARFSPQFHALCDEASIDFLPRDAGRKMAGLVLKMSAESARATVDVLGGYSAQDKYYEKIAALGALTLQYTDAINKPRPHTSVETTRDITTARRISLRQGEGAQTP